VGALAASMPSPSTMVSVVDDSGRVLFRSTQADLVSQSDPITEAAPLRKPPAPADSVAPPFVSSSWPILLDEVSPLPPGRLVLSETEEEVLGPVARFSRTFVWVVLLSGLGVLLLTGSQIRRSLVPLAELREGTRPHRAARFRQPDLGGEPRRVRGAGQLVQHDGRPARATVSGALDGRGAGPGGALGHRRRVLVDTLLARTRDVFPCHMVGVTLVGSDGGKSMSGVVYDYCEDVRHASRVELHSDDVQDLLDGPDLVLLDAGDATLPVYLDPMLRLDRAPSWSCRCASAANWWGSSPSATAPRRSRA